MHQNLFSETRRTLEVALRRKNDDRLLHLIVAMYILNYLDRSNIAAARLAGSENEFEVALQLTSRIVFVGSENICLGMNVLLLKVLSQ